MARRLGGLGASLATLLSACSLFTALDGFTDDDDGGRAAAIPDGALPDGEVSADVNSVSDAGDSPSVLDAGGEGGASADGGLILANGGFENGTCGPPMGSSASTTTTQISAIARTGMHSCRVCSVAPNAFYGLFHDLPLYQWGPGKYTLDVHIQTDGDGGGTIAVAQLTVKSTDGGAPRYPGKNSGANPIGWTHLTVIADVAPGEFLSGLLVGGNAPLAGQCVFVDDVSIVRE